MEKRIAIASDHAGFNLKRTLLDYLQKKGYEVKDFGTFNAESTDYPDFGHPLAESIESGQFPLGISLCASGNGINMTANKHQGIRAAICWKSELATLARAHNDANICSLPARFLNEKEAIEIVEAFLSTPFEGGRHKCRIDKIPLIHK